VTDLRRWRLVLGGGDADGTGAELAAADAGVDAALGALYDGERKGGLGSSAPRVARWLGDIRGYFPTPIVRILQRDALERLELRKMLLEPELLSAVVPDVHLVTMLVSLAAVMPARTRETARAVVRRVVDDLLARVDLPLRQAVAAATARAARSLRPRPRDIDWRETIRRNLRHYQPALRTIIPETLVGHGRHRHALRDVILCVDQSGSMASSIVHAGIAGAVLAALPSVTTRLVLFDTAVVDATDALHDPVELLFGAQLGGGTDINRALAYCQSLVTRPAETILFLVSDLYEGGDADEMLARARALAAAGVRVVALLSLSDEGAPAYDHDVAAALAALDIPAFATTPDLFPPLLAAAIEGRDLSPYAASTPSAPPSTRARS
jgi:Mg-chelatase subunit ChlD